MPKKIRSYRDLDVYRRAVDAAMAAFEFSKSFPKEETYSLTDQIRRATRSVCANISEAWHKRRYAPSFISKLSDAETEAAESQVWLEFAVKCGYMRRADALDLYKRYDAIIATIVGMITHPKTWTFPHRGPQ